MKKNKKPKLFLIFFTAATLISATLASQIVSGWTTVDYPTIVYGGYENENLYIGGLSNTAMCDNSLIRFRPSTSDTKKVEILARTAIVAGKRISCLTDGCDGVYQKGLVCFIEKGGK